MEAFDITVTGIEDQEYREAMRRNNLRIYKLLALVMVIICGVIILISGNVSTMSLLAPVLIYVLIAVVLEIFSKVSYKGQLREIDPMVYHFSETGWKVTLGGTSNTYAWKQTTMLKRTKSCLFFYIDEASSNLCPRRLLNQEQEAQIDVWYRESRTESKKYQKEQAQKEREEFRREHQGLRFGNRGTRNKK